MGIEGTKRNVIEYVVSCISEFAMRHGLTNRQAYSYLMRFGGLGFLIDCYEAEHTLSIDDAMQDVLTICSRNGGRIA